jgi:O-Antigen ligase
MKNTSRNNTIRLELYLLGMSLWMPGVALFSVGDLWGLQVAAVILTLLSMHWLLLFISNKIYLKSINTYNEWVVSHSMFFFSIILSTAFSRIGVEKSIKTLSVEMIGLVFSISTTWWLCQDKENFKHFINGFKLAGLLSAMYAVYQFVGLRIGLPFAYIEMYNASFSIINLDMTTEMIRAISLTPEPSILASLLWIMLGISISDILNIGGLRSYLIFSCIFLGIISTSSQSIGLIPLYLILILSINKKLSSQLRSFNVKDLAGTAIIIIPVMYLISTNENIIFWLNRIVDIDDNTSGQMRSNEIIVGLSMFAYSPLCGLGLGSIGDMMESFSIKENVTHYGGINNGLIRVLVEQGLLGILNIVFAFRCITPSRIGNLVFSRSFLCVVMYQISFVLSGVIALSLFVGYRNLYHLWLILPVGIAMKSYLKAEMNPVF